MIPAGSRICESVWMRKGIEVRLGPGDRERLEAVIGSGNSPQKHVWRARIVLLSADGVGTMAIQRETGKGKPTIWRWQARFMTEGVDGLLHEATRPAGKPPLTAAVVGGVVAMTLAEPPGERTHWTGRAMAKAAGVSHRSVQRIWAAHGLKPHRVRTFKGFVTLTNAGQEQAGQLGFMRRRRQPPIAPPLRLERSAASIGR